MVADCLLYSAAMEYLHMVENFTVRPVLTEWLSAVASHLDLDSYILSGIAILCVSRLT